MKREILFKAKRSEDGEWVYGSYLLSNGTHLIMNQSAQTENAWAFTYEVDPETISQFTGVSDKEGEKIFENDIVHFLDWDGIGEDEYWNLGYVHYDEMGFYFSNRESVDMVDVDFGETKVVGNVFDDQEVIEDFNNRMV